MVRFPLHLETSYAARLVRRQEVARTLLGERLAWLDKRSSRLDIGGEDKRVNGVVAAVKAAYQLTLPVKSSDLLVTAQAVDAWATRSQVRAVSELVDVDIEKDGRIGTNTRDEMRALHLSWARANVDLIKSMDSDTFDDVAKHVVDSVVNGRTDLAEVLVDRFGVAESRARLIARDQVAKLNGQVTQARQEQLGIVAYEWSSSGDARVRPLHKKLDGSVRRWDNPHPTEGHPGMPIACRCVAIPVVDPELIPEAPKTPAPPLAVPLVPKKPPAPPSYGISPGGLPAPNRPAEDEPLIPDLPAPAFVAPPSSPRVPFLPPSIGPSRGGLFDLPTTPDIPAVVHPRDIPPPPLAPPAPATNSAENILHDQTGAATGSNAGGFYTGKDGVKRYVKLYADPAQANGEHLTNEIYRALGLGSPTSTTFENGSSTAYASEIIDGTKTLRQAGLTQARAKKVLDGFAADVLTANWDAVGLDLDNILIGKGGKLIRVDNGGSLLMRAQAGRKPSHLLNDIPEWTGFFDPYKNPSYAKVAKAAGYGSAAEIPSLAKQIKAIVKLRDDSGGWAAFVDSRIPGLQGADRDAVISMLESRTGLLESRLKAIAQAKRAATAAARRAASGQPASIAELLRRTYQVLDRDQALQHGRELVAARTAAGFTTAERDAVRYYTSNAGYTRLNGAARAGRVDPGQALVDTGVARGKMLKDTVLTRGIDNHPQLGELFRTGSIPVGTVIEDKAVQSTSLASAGAFQKAITLRIRAPAGSTGLWIQDFSHYSTELEVLLPRNARFQIIAPPTKVGGSWVVECLLLP